MAATIMDALADVLQSEPLQAQSWQLFLRATVIDGDTLKDNYCVIHDGRQIARILKASGRSTTSAVWDWMINIPLTIPPGCTGKAAGLEEAKEAFKAAWDRFLPSLTERQIAHWHHHQDAADHR